MCGEISSTNETRIIKNVRYQVCPNCNKPISGTGKSLGGHAIWVVKKFVKNKRLVHFDRMWAKVCVAAGFEVVHWHRAMLLEYKGSQFDLDGGMNTRVIKRASFFRRLAEKKGSPKIDWETVICMRKPES